ncbi:hypothetical protein LLS1_25320 [Leifsonia sp. LS1]|nr:hypothetical protein LLS1_25320 [Leifsonia sp. LS1]
MPPDVELPLGELEQPVRTVAVAAATPTIAPMVLSVDFLTVCISFDGFVVRWGPCGFGDPRGVRGSVGCGRLRRAIQPSAQAG